jgi:hypothetical protein
LRGTLRCIRGRRALTPSSVAEDSSLPARSPAESPMRIVSIRLGGSKPRAPLSLSRARIKTWRFEGLPKLILIPSSRGTLAGPALARIEFDQPTRGNPDSCGSKTSRRINDLERHQADNQVFFNGFSKVIKCGLRGDLADGFGAIGKLSRAAGNLCQGPHRKR